MDRRGQRRDNHTGTQHRKPPRGAWEPTVSSWEKEFCKAVGSIPWQMLVQLKKWTHLFPEVIEWNDSACEEAFINARKRFWAQKKGFSCNIPLPDPDLYIDKIDWDAYIDPELFQDLESAASLIDEEGEEEEENDDNKSPAKVFDDPLTVDYQTITPTGWGDKDDDEKLDAPPVHSSANHADPWAASSSTGWGEAGCRSWGIDPYPTALPAGPILGRTHSNVAWQGYSSAARHSGHGYGPVNPNSGGGWNNGNVTTRSNGHVYVPSYNISRPQVNEEWKNYTPRNNVGRYKPPYARRQAA